MISGRPTRASGRAREKDARQVANEIFTGDPRVVHIQQLSIVRSYFLHELITALRFETIGAHGQLEQQLPLLERDAMADEPQYARGAKTVESALRDGTGLIRDSGALFDHESLRRKVSEPASVSIEDGDQPADGIQ